jgi:PleD family two-component response regulator
MSRKRSYPRAVSTLQSDERDDAKNERKALILLVDDYEDKRALYSIYLDRCGFAVEEASDGLEAIRPARSCLA